MNRCTTTRTLFIGLILAAGLLPTAALAASWDTWCGIPIKWNTNSVEVRHSAASFTPGTRLRTRSEETIWHFNQNPSRLRITVGWDDASVKTGNGQNEVWFTNDDLSAPAVTSLRYRGRWRCAPRLHEADVRLEQHAGYTSSTHIGELWPFSGVWRPYATTLLHELGHVAGLDHEARFYNIMGADWTHIHSNDGHARAYLGEDAGNGLVALYGKIYQHLEDLSVSQFKYAGNPDDDAYSDHERTVMRAHNGQALGVFYASGEPVYYVRRGQSVKVEFTYENNGKSTQSSSAGFYLSSNDNITLNDRRIGGWSTVLARNEPATVSRLVTVPGDAPLGYAWLGVYIDEDHEVIEVTGDNNATHQRIYVLP